MILMIFKIAQYFIYFGVNPVKAISNVTKDIQIFMHMQLCTLYSSKL